MTPRDLRIRRHLTKLGITEKLELSPPVTTKAQLKRFEGVVDKLIADGHVEVLRALIAGSVTLAELVDLDRRGELLGPAVLSRAQLLRPLWATWEELEQSMGRKATSRKRYGVSRKSLQRWAGEWLPADAPFLALEKVPWAVVRERWLAERSAADWNRMISALSRVCSLVLGDKYHPFRRALMAKMQRESEVVRVPDLSPDTFWAILSHEPRPDVRAAFVTLAVTGLRVGEYLGLDPSTHLQPETKRIMVPVEGKTGSRYVPVPESYWAWVVAAVPAPLQYRALWQHWKDACKAAGVQLRLHDLRHAAGQWATDAGVSPLRVKDLFGHKTVGTTDRYTRVQNAAVASDAIGKVLDAAQAAKASKTA